MTWIEYANLIEGLDTNPANWKSAAEGNPNNPFDALTLAIRESTINDVTRLIKVLLLSVDEIPAQPVATFIMALVAQLPVTPDDDTEDPRAWDDGSTASNYGDDENTMPSDDVTDYDVLTPDCQSKERKLAGDDTEEMARLEGTRDTTMASKLSPTQQAIVDAMRDGGIFTEHFGRTVVHIYGDQVTRIDVTKPTFKLLISKGVIQDTGRRTKLGWNIYELTDTYQSKER